MSAIEDVAAERVRQVEAERWDTKNDDVYIRGELAMAAVCYARQAARPVKYVEWCRPDDWPWNSHWWKPTTPRRDLVKAAALLVAEIERLDRLTPPRASDAAGDGGV